MTSFKKKKDRRIAGSLCVFVVAWIVFALMLAGCAARKPVVSEDDQNAAMNLYRLAFDYFLNGNSVSSLHTLEEAEKYNSCEPKIKNLYGMIYLGKKLHSQAEESFKDALRCDLKFVEAYVGLGTVYMDQGLWNQAIEALKIPADDIMYANKEIVFDNLGWCYHKLGDDKKATEYLQTALIHNQDFCHAYYNLGLVHKERGRLPEAMDALEQSVAKCEKFLFGYFELAQIAIQARESQKARGALEKCIELGGASSEARECKKLLGLLP